MVMSGAELADAMIPSSSSFRLQWFIGIRFTGGTTKLWNSQAEVSNLSPNVQQAERDRSAFSSDRGLPEILISL